MSRQLQSIRLTGLDDDGVATDELGLLRRGDPVRRRHDDLVARTDQSSSRQVQRLLAAAVDDHVFRRVFKAVVSGQPLHDRLLELRNTGRLGVLGVAVPDGLDAGLFDVLGGIEVRLPGRQGDDIDAVALHLLGLGIDRHRRRRFDALDVFG